MKKLNLEELESTQGGVRLRTCLIAGGMTGVAVAIGFGMGSFWGASAAFVAALSSANYNGCI